MKLAGCAALAVALLIIAPCAASETGYGGTIYFRDGGSVSFEWFGTLKGVRRAYLKGELGKQNVELDLSDVREIILADQHIGYGGKSYGELIVVNTDGERFTISNAFIAAYSPGFLQYVFQNPITKDLRETTDTFSGRIASIQIGAESGPMKRNPDTGEFFPPTFVYDPYTGARLVWSSR